MFCFHRFFYSILIGILVFSFNLAESTPPVIESMALYTNTDSPTDTLIPGNEMFFLVNISDPDPNGFANIHTVTFYLWHTSASKEDPDNPNNHATYLWENGTGTETEWRMLGPTESSWAINQSNCSAPNDGNTSTTTQILRLAFTPGISSVYDETSNWHIDIDINSGGGDSYGSITVKNAYYGKNIKFIIAPTICIAGTSTSFAIQRQDDNGNLIWTGTSTILLTFDKPEQGTYSSLIIPEGTSTVSFFFYSEKAGFGTITAILEQEHIIATVTVIPDSAYRLDFLEAATSTIAGIPAFFTLQRKDRFDNPVISGQTIIGAYRTGNQTGYFRDTEGATGTTISLTFKDGTSSVGFYYYDEKAGSCTIKFTTSGIKTTSTTISILHGLPSGKITLVPSLDNIVADGTNTISITSSSITDAYFNTVTTGNIVVLKTNLGTIEPQTVQTDSNGKIYFTLQTGFISGTATIEVKTLSGTAFGTIAVIFTPLPCLEINEIPNSIQPFLVTQGENASLQIGVINSGSNTVILEPASEISFGEIYKSKLNTWINLEPGQKYYLRFKASDVPNDMQSKSYPITMLLLGYDANNQRYSKIISGDNKIEVLPPYIWIEAENVPFAFIQPSQLEVETLKITARNSYLATKTITGLKIANATVGSGTQSELDSQISNLYLYQNKILLATAIFNAGTATFEGLNIPIQPEGSVTLSIFYDLSLKMAKDGDIIDISLVDIGIQDADIKAEFPLDSFGYQIINGFINAQVDNHQILTANILSNSQNNPVLDITIPSNGYASDVLKAISVQNIGTAIDRRDIKSVKCWIKGTLTNVFLGTLTWSGDRWIINGLNQSITAQQGLGILITIDIAESPDEEVTIRMIIPINGIEVGSQNRGPIDMQIENLYIQQINIHDRVVFEALPLVTQTRKPSEKDIKLMELAVTNYYDSPQTITTLSLTNKSIGSGTQAELDSELGMVYLLENCNITGISTFKQGRADFSNLSISLLPKETRYIYISYDLSSNMAKNDDLIDCAINSPLDIGFYGLATRIKGVFPLNSKGENIIDGAVQAQIINFGAPPITVPRNKSNVLLMDIVIPSNGYATDTIKNMKLKNSGIAVSPRDILSVKLWADGGNNEFDHGLGDDKDLGIAVWQTETLLPYWQWRDLNLPIPVLGKRIFVSADISDEPFDASTIQMKIPVNGLEFESSNDGPRDTELINPARQIICLVPLMTQMEVTPQKVAPLALVTITMTIKNLSPADTVGLINPVIFGSGSGLAILISGPVPGSLSISAGESKKFIWQYQSKQAGTITFYGSATSIAGGAIESISNTLLIQNIPTIMTINHFASMPVSVNTGQTDIVPLSFIFSNSNPDNMVGDIKITSLDFQINAKEGVGTAPCHAISRITLNGETIVYGSKSSIEMTGNTIRLPLTSPIIVLQDKPVIANLHIDIPKASTTKRFTVSLQNIIAEDANSGTQIQTDFAKIDSGETLIQAEPTNLKVDLIDKRLQYVNRGQTNLMPIQIQFANNSSESGDIKITQIQFHVENEQGIITPVNVISHAKLKDNDSIISEISCASGDNSILMPFSLPIIVRTNETKTVSLLLDINPNPSIASFSLSIVASSSITARDSNTGREIDVSANFPLKSDAIIFQNKAQSALITAASIIPPVVYQGQTQVRCLKIDITNQGNTDNSDIILNNLNLFIKNDMDIDLDKPNQTISQLNVGGKEILIDRNPVLIPLDLRIKPGSVSTIEVLADTVHASSGNFKIVIGSITILDANDASFQVDIGDTLPIQSNLAQIQVKADKLQVQSESQMPINTFRGEKGIEVIKFTLVNIGGTNTSAIEVRELRFRITDRFGNQLEPNQVISQLKLRCGTFTFTAKGSIVELPPNRLRVTVGSQMIIEIMVDILDNVTAGHFKLGLNSGMDILAFDTISGETVTVTAASNYLFPMDSDVINIFQPSLKETFTNYPNPFEAGRESTVITYYLEQDAVVTIKLYTIIGDLVINLLDNESKKKGMRQEDKWDGRNGDRDVVLNGVYLCHIKVRYANGNTEEMVRKIAVIR